ncbi:hypothetical protein GWG10_09425 [Aeromonas caviae]|uniref:hypothetical protein n=1 Tax=Aeromonas caviae TaxID=648 RepID=UPI0015E0124C|nr:hypothetical protein [Aeromonas caviae]QLL88426.1 hypothetical protein GWG10_09425 [Aeromonas caviae]
MHVILTTSLFGERSGNAGDPLIVASQEEADELVRAGYARYADPDQKPPRKGRGGTSAAT